MCRILFPTAVAVLIYGCSTSNGAAPAATVDSGPDTDAASPAEASAPPAHDSGGADASRGGDAASPPDASPDAQAASSLRFIWHNSSATDPYTGSPDATQQQWFQQHMWGMQVYSPYFDDKLSWFPNGFVYSDSYAIYNPLFSPWDTRSQDHPDWIFKDANGNNLYIPFDCNKNGTGTCTQFAADFTNAAYRSDWIGTVKAAQAKGYRAVWVDDVNLDFRVSDGMGNHVDPIDPSTGQAMTAANWAKYFAQFLAQVRQELPGMTILHNSIWYAGPVSDPSITLEIQSADYVNLERGVNDTGLTGGTGTFGLRSLFSFIDGVHGLGRSAVLDAESANDLIPREYSLAAYYLIWGEADAIGNDAITPDTWWNGYDVKLGAPAGARYDWKGLIRRDYGKGFVVVDEPGAPDVTVSISPPANRLDGTTVSSLTLSAAQGAVLLRP